MKNIFVLIVLYLSFVATLHSQKNDLFYRLEIGQQYKQSITSEISNVFSMKRDQYTTVSTINNDINYKVVDKTENDYELSIRYSYISYTFKNQNNHPVTISSNTPTKDSPFAKVLKVISESTFRFKMTKYGEILEVNNLDSLWIRIDNALIDQSNVQRDAIVTELKKEFGEEEFKNRLDVLFNILPKNPVERKQSWERNYTLDNGIKFIVQQTMVLEDFSNIGVEFSFKGKIKSTSGGGYSNFNGFLIKMDVTGNISGTMELEAETLWPKRVVTHITQKGNGTIDKNENFPKKMTFPIEGKIKTEISQ